MAYFADSDVIGRRKYARFLGLSLKSYEIKSQTVSWLRTQSQCENFTKKSKNILPLIWLNILRWIMGKFWENAKMRQKTTFARLNSVRNLVMHFYKPHIIFKFYKNARLGFSHCSISQYFSPFWFRIAQITQLAQF